MKLYDFAYSPNSRKVRAVAHELRIALESCHVDLLAGGSRTPAFLAINPNGRVPVLVDGDFVLWESTAIIRYLSSKRDGALVPTSARGQAEMDRWICWQLAHLGPAMSKVAFERIVKRLTGQGPADEAAILAGSAEFAKLTAVLESALQRRGREAEYLAGELSLADFALASHYSLAAACGLELGRFERVSAWLARVLERESMKRALAEAQATVRSNAA
ncbi:MAG TPA: glutathione S-transferase family protein [Polyangiaceae bacterium]|nr:glutathione S-transferase family protein [Polyangiaceae bacterium]